MTGCKKPCIYKQYKFIGQQTALTAKFNYFVLALWSVTNFTKVETEMLVYPFTSLVAEFGGVLGLFLGFSFMTFWDGLEYLTTLVQKWKVTN